MWFRPPPPPPPSFAPGFFVDPYSATATVLAVVVIAYVMSHRAGGRFSATFAVVTAVANYADACEKECSEKVDALQTILRRKSSENLLIEAGDMPVPVQRFKSEDVKGAVNRVLLPKLVSHQSFICQQKKRMKRGELEPLAARETINESSREFTKRYADCVQVAKQLANESGVVPLRRLASSKESWAAAELMAALQGSSLPDDFVPDSQSG